MATCRYGRKKSGACKRKPGPKKSGSARRSSSKKRCKFGVSKTTGKCLKRKRSRR